MIPKPADFSWQIILGLVLFALGFIGVAYEPALHRQSELLEVGLVFKGTAIIVLIGGFWLIPRDFSNANRRAERRAAGLCIHGGYDLRATPHRCPECGRVPEPSPVDTISPTDKGKDYNADKGPRDDSAG